MSCFLLPPFAPYDDEVDDNFDEDDLLLGVLVTRLPANEHQIAHKSHREEGDQGGPGKLAPHDPGSKCLRKRGHRAEEVQHRIGGHQAEVLPQGSQNGHQLEEDGNDGAHHHADDDQFLWRVRGKREKVLIRMQW